MHQHYHSGLVLVSLVVAILASYTALTLALRIRVATPGSAYAWLLGGGLVMGIGIWAMHFLGMLAMALPIEITYDVSITLLSLIIAIVVSTFALRIASRESVGALPLAAAAIAMGMGICSMHYVGMAAIEIAPPIRYSFAWVAISFAIAMIASFAALGIAFARRAEGWWRYHRALGAAGMGVAICGMHYAGMIAARFPEHALAGGGSMMSKPWLAGSVATITLFVLVAALLVSFIEARAAAQAARMQASLAEANETSRAKDEFLAMLGHELRNPLASITNAVHLLGRAAPSGGDWRLAYDVIARQSSHLVRMADDLLDVGRTVAGKISLERQPLDLHLAVGHALSALKAAGKTAGRHVDYGGNDTGSSSWVNADRTRIEQVLSNLVSNAVKHTAEGGRIALRVTASGGEVVLTVADDGAGMDAETAARAFELFYQARREPDRRRDGLGLGLTLARRIVELHGGTIGGASDGPGKGATFTVRLPAIAAPRTAAAAGAQAASRARQIVIVEDSSDARLSLQMLLESEGHTVHTAIDGPSGLDTIMQVQPDVALVDIGLPGLDGYGLAERLRSAGLDTYLVALTGYGRREDKVRARDAGFDAHVTKPAPTDYLLRLVAEAAEK